MAAPKGGKPGALDAFWDTYGSTSSTSGSMSDLLSSLPGSPSARKAPQKKERPVGGPESSESKGDPILLLLSALLSEKTNELTMVQIIQQTGIGPSEIQEVIAKAADLGLVEPAGPEKKSYRLTADGNELARTAS